MYSGSTGVFGTGTVLAATGFRSMGILLIGLACVVLGLAFMRSYLVRKS